MLSVIVTFYMVVKDNFQRRAHSFLNAWDSINIKQVTPWRNGSASDSRSEGCVFKSRRGQGTTVFLSICYVHR